MSYRFGDRSIKRLEGVHENLIVCASKALYASDFDMTIPWMGGLRTAKEQNEIFKKGYSQRDGYTRKSYHQTGMAIDIIPVDGGYTNGAGFRHFAGKMFSQWQSMIKNGQIPENMYLEWGGHWTSFIDKPHWQVII